MKQKIAKKIQDKVFISRIHLWRLFVGFSILLLTISCSAPSTAAQGPIHNYYVDYNLGSDQNSGYQDLPWQTIQKAANTLIPGDTVTVAAGNYPERIVVNHSGTSGFPITFQAEGIVTMNGFTINANYIKVKNFEISDTENDTTSGWGIFVQGSECDIENNYIHDATRGGILIDAIAGSESLVTDCVIKNNRLYHNSQVGIEVHGCNHIVEGNEIWKTIQYHPKWLNPPSWEDADGVRFLGSGPFSAETISTIFP